MISTKKDGIEQRVKNKSIKESNISKKKVRKSNSKN